VTGPRSASRKLSPNDVVGEVETHGVKAGQLGNPGGVARSPPDPVAAPGKQFAVARPMPELAPVGRPVSCCHSLRDFLAAMVPPGCAVNGEK
jgi:hypothetical protein